MKKILIAVMALTIGLMAENAVEIFDNKPGQSGGMVGKTITFIYPENDMMKITDIRVLEKIKVNLIDNICKAKSERDLVQKGYKVLLIYPGAKKTSIFVVDDCTGYPKSK